jgi:hypothetical protein
VGSDHTARLAPEVLRHLDDANAATLRDIDRDLDNGRKRVETARKALSVAQAETVSPGAAEVHAAKVARAESDLQWEQSLVRTFEWRRSVTCAASELAKAQTLSRAGDDIDVTAYIREHQRMRAGQEEASRTQAAKRTQLDDSERRLGVAKARYAQSRTDQVVATSDTASR